MSEKMELAGDIVERLRSASTDLCHPTGCCYGETMVEAADEIERFRTMENHFKQTIAPNRERAAVISTLASPSAALRASPAEAQVPEYMRGDPRAAVSPPHREEIAALIEKHVFVGVDHLLNDTLKAADTILALYPAGDGREADFLSGEKGKPE